MVPDEKLQSSAAKPLAAEAETIWERMSKDYEDTIWDDRAKEGAKRLLGLHWQPSGGLRTIVHYQQGVNVAYELDPLKVGQEAHLMKSPPGSGGLLAALYQYRRLLTQGPAGFEGACNHGGQEPIYPSVPDTRRGQSWNEVRTAVEVLHTEHAAVPVKWYFALKDQNLLGFETTVDAEDDPCEVYLSDYRPVEGRQLPHRIEVRHGNEIYGTFTIQRYQLAAAK